MIPTVEDILLQLERGDITYNQARSWMTQHFILCAEEAAARPEERAPKWVRTGVTLPEDGQTVLAYWEFVQEPHPNESNYGVVTFNGHMWHEPADDEVDFRQPEWWAALPAGPVATSSPQKGPTT